MRSLLVVASVGVLIALTGIADGPTRAASASETGGVRFDPTVTLGHMLSALLIVAAVLGTYLRLRVDMTEIRTKVDAMWTKFIRDQ